MDNIYLLMLVALAVLAVVDIVVGVSNDAINFLNSAIGSKAISIRTIMIVASLGIFIGAVFLIPLDYLLQLPYQLFLTFWGHL